MNTLEKGMMLGYFYKGAFHPKYKITRQMNIPGEGNSRLYIATDVASNTRVVAKLPKGDPSEEDDQSTLNIENAMIRSRERQILVEHQFLKTNKHPNIAACKDLARTKDGCPALILEDLSDSLSLEELLKYSRRFQTPVGERADRRFREFANLTYGTAWHSIGTDDSDPQEIHEKPDALGLTSHSYGSIAQLVDV